MTNSTDPMAIYIPSLLFLNRLEPAILCSGVAANILNLIAFSQRKVWRHYVASYLTALSITDLLLLLSYAGVALTDVHIGTAVGCFASQFVYGALTTLSPWLLVSVSLDRALHTFGKRGLTNYAGVAAVLVACCALVSSHVFYTSVYVQPADPTMPMHCARRSGFELAASTLDCVATALAPGLALSALNCCIACRVRGAYRRLLGKAGGTRCAQSSQLMSSIETSWDNNPAAAAAAAGDRMRRSRQVTVMLLCVSLAYLLLNLPNSAAMLLSALLPADASQSWVLRALLARRYGQALYLLHFSMNSLVCACANRRYKKALKCAAVRIRAGCCSWVGGCPTRLRRLPRTTLARQPGAGNSSADYRLPVRVDSALSPLPPPILPAADQQQQAALMMNNF